MGIPGFHTAPATTPAEMEAVHNLRREAFLEVASPPGLGVEDGYDGRPNCRSFLLYSGEGEPVGTIRACVFARTFDWSPIPAFELFGSEIGRFDSGTALVQSTSFAVSAGHRGVDLGPKLLLIREILRAAIVHQADHVVTIVRDQPSLVRFYRRMGFTPLGAPGSHPLANRDVVLIGVRSLEFLRSVRSHPKLGMIGDFAEAP